jgi:protein PhnA
MAVKDSNGNELSDGDSVQVIKDLKVKGSSANLKQGKVFKNIRLTAKDDEIECREGKSTLVLKTCFLKKA